MKISVVIPTYNREYIIRNAIESVLNQTYQIYEIIIVDDGSTDNTVDLLDSINNDKIKVINNKYKKGANGSRNTGIEFATGDYIAFQDSDDIWLDNKLEEQVKVFEENPEVEFCFCSFESGTKKGIIPRKQVEMSEVSKKLYEGNFIGTPTMIMKANVAKTILFSQELKRFQDWDFVLRVSQKYKIYHLNKVLVIANQQNDSISKSSKDITAVALNELIEMYPGFKNKSIRTKVIYNSMKVKISYKNKKYMSMIIYAIKYIFYKSSTILLKKGSK